MEVAAKRIYHMLLTNLSTIRNLRIREDKGEIERLNIGSGRHTVFENRKSG
jgi:hypothetical protein